MQDNTVTIPAVTEVPKKKRGNPNWGKPKQQWTSTEKITKFEKESNNKSCQQDSIVWVMFMQATIETWQAKTDLDIGRAAALADKALEEYQKRFKG